MLPQDRLMILRNHSPNHQPPSPILLEVHACIAEILNASGMGTFIEQILRELEQTRCLAEDEGTNVGALLMVVRFFFYFDQHFV